MKLVVDYILCLVFCLKYGRVYRAMIYLASPFSHICPFVRYLRYRDACRCLAYIIRDGYICFSPIVHSYPLLEHGLYGDWGAWSRYDLKILERCDELWVLALDGWKESIGVQAEIKFFSDLRGDCYIKYVCLLSDGYKFISML